MTPEELEYANKQANYMRDLMQSCTSKDDALRAAWDERNELQQRAESAEARAASLADDVLRLERRVTELTAENRQSSETVATLRAEVLTAWEEIETLKRQLAAARFERMAPLDWRETETPLGIALDGQGDEVEP